MGNFEAAVRQSSLHPSVAARLLARAILRTMRTEGWMKTQKGLTRIFNFPDRRILASFATALFQNANQMNHHPDIKTKTNSITVTYCTHSEGDTVTDLDYEAAKQADQLAMTFCVQEV